MRNVMKWKNAGVMMAAGVMAAAILTGCGRDSGTPVETTAKTTVAEETSGETATAGSEAVETEVLEQTSSTIRVSTSHGEVELPVNPERVVVFDMGVLDSMDYLEVDVEAAVPTANLLSHLSEYETSVNAGGIKEPDMEAIYEFEPDLIIISGRQESFYDELSKIAPTWFVDTDYSSLMEDFERNYTTLGRIFAREDAVKAAMDSIKEQIASVKEVTGGREESALILLTNDGNISAYGSGSRFGMIHDVLGVKAADDAIDASTHGQSVGYEYISQVNPDILFVVDRTAIVAGTTTAGDTLDNDLVKATNAWKNGKVIYLNPENWYLAGTGLNTFPDMIGEVKAAFE